MIHSCSRRLEMEVAYRPLLMGLCPVGRFLSRPLLVEGGARKGSVRTRVENNNGRS